MPRRYNLTPQGRKARAERMRKLNADPAFKEKAAERMRKLRADPAFKEKMRKLRADPAFNPLAVLTPQQREDYDVLRKVGKYSRKEALQLVCGQGATKKKREMAT